MSPRARAKAGRLLVGCWAVGTVVLAALPSGVGGMARAVDVTVFLLLGPAAALAVRRTGRSRLDRPAAIALEVVLGLTVALTVPVLVGMLLLTVGAWNPWVLWGATALVTLGIVAVPARMPEGSGGAR